MTSRKPERLPGTGPKPFADDMGQHRYRQALRAVRPRRTRAKKPIRATLATDNANGDWTANQLERLGVNTDDRFTVA